MTTTIKQTIIEIVCILLLALCLALLYHAVSPSGIVIFKKKQGTSPSSFLLIPQGAVHGS